MPNEQRPLKVFLCHAHGDKGVVRDLYLRLIRDGVDAWLDKEKLLPGQDWEFEIRKAVREADVVVVCLSKQFNQAGFRQKEVRLALDTAMEQPEGEIFIIPARLEECDTLESLRKWQWVDLFEEDGYQRLINALRSRADRIGATLRIHKAKQAISSHSKSKKIEEGTGGAVSIPTTDTASNKGIVSTTPAIENPEETKATIIAKPQKAKSRKLSNTTIQITVALIGALATILAALLGSPLLDRLLRSPATQIPAIGSSTTVSTPQTSNGVLEPLYRIAVSSQPIRAVAFSPDSTKLAAASKDKTIYLFDTTDGKQILKLEGHTQAVTSVTWSPDGSQLASGSEDQSVRIWDVATGQQVSSLAGHKKAVYSVAWSHDGKRIASAGDETRVILWNVANGEILFQVDQGVYGNSVAWSPSDTLLAVSAAGKVLIVDPNTGNKIQELVGDWGDINGVDWSPDGKYLAAAGHDNHVHVWQVNNWNEQIFEGHTNNVTDVAWSNNSQLVASISYDGTVRVWDIRTKKEIPLEPANPAGALTLDWSSDGKRLAGGGEVATNGYIEIWDATQFDQ